MSLKAVVQHSFTPNQQALQPTPARLVSSSFMVRLLSLCLRSALSAGVAELELVRPVQPIMELNL